MKSLLCLYLEIRQNVLEEVGPIKVRLVEVGPLFSIHLLKRQAGLQLMTSERAHLALALGSPCRILPCSQTLLPAFLFSQQPQPP